MLKKFFLHALSSFLGAWIALVLFGIICVMVVIGIVARFGVTTANNISVKNGSILTLHLEGEIIENNQSVELDYLELIQGDFSKKKTLTEIVGAIEAAKDNENIDAIYLKCGVAIAAPATYNAIRNALLDFKTKGKKIIAYGDVYPMGPYYVASVADEIYLNPGGSIALQGLGGTTLFYKGLFDKLGIEVQVVKVGTYKSAVEPYISTSMSQPARAQLDTLYGNMWKFIREGISAQRKDLTPSGIDSLVSEDFIFLKKGKAALAHKLVDDLYFERSMDSVIASSLGKEKKNLNFVDPSLLISQESLAFNNTGKEQIAVLYATGEIVDGGESSTINFQRFVPIIISLAEDKNVKGMVLRVNSPGGSVFGSEQIGDALDYFQSKGKPLAVSMGDYAASGGYWISCCANRIYADPLTITGSIGIFGLIPNIEKLTEKIGLNAETVSTNPNAQFPAIFKAMTLRQTEAMQEMVSEGYDEFVSRVAKGRHLPETTVRKIGEGRVWDAESAIKIGLVDSLGGLQDAINWISEEIGSTNYTLSVYPRIENSVWEFLPEILNMESNMRIKQTIGENLPIAVEKKLIRLLKQHPVQAKMPEIKTIL